MTEIKPQNSQNFVKSVFKDLKPTAELDLIEFEQKSAAISHSQASLLSQREINAQTQFSFNAGLFSAITPPQPPKSLAQLLHYCDVIAGRSVEQVARKFNVEVIDSLERNKGWLGNLIELALGTSAGSKPTQDFVDLGIELKTVAINAKGNVKSDIFVSSLPVNSFMLQRWESSHVLYKLQHILFVPVESNPQVPLRQRLIGQGKLWRPTAQQLVQLQQDWNQIMQLITENRFDLLKSNVGTYLCVRVKALNNRQFNLITDADGYKQKLPPLSFYLRREFVNQIIQQLY